MATAPFRIIMTHPAAGAGQSRSIGQITHRLLPRQLPAVPHEHVFPVGPVRVPPSQNERLIALVADLVRVYEEVIELCNTQPGRGVSTDELVGTFWHKDHAFRHLPRRHQRNLDIDIGRRTYKDLHPRQRAGCHPLHRRVTFLLHPHHVVAASDSETPNRSDADQLRVFDRSLFGSCHWSEINLGTLGLGRDRKPVGHDRHQSGQ